MKHVRARESGLLVLLFLLNLTCSGAKAAGCATPESAAQQALCAAAVASAEVNTIVSNFGNNNNLAIQQLSTQSDIQLSTAVVSSPAAQRAQVSCIAALRNGVAAPGCAASTTAGKAKSTSDDSTGIGVSVTASWARATQDTTDGQTGFEANTPGLVLAVDRMIAPKLLLGGALGWQKADMDFEYQGSDSGHLDSNTVRGMAYLNYAFTKTAYAEFSAGYGHLSFDSERLCPACSQAKTRNTASYGGSEVLLSAGIGNSYRLSTMTIGAYARGDYLHFTTDSYSEEGTMAPGLGNRRTALEVDEQSLNSFTTVIGGQAAYVISRNHRQLTPRARLEWVHEFANDSRIITSRFRDASGFTIGLPTASPERNWLNAGIGLDINVERAWNLAFDYAHLFKRDASADQVAAKFKYNF